MGKMYVGGGVFWFYCDQGDDISIKS